MRVTLRATVMRPDEGGDRLPAELVMEADGRGGPVTFRFPPSGNEYQVEAASLLRAARAAWAIVGPLDNLRID